VDLKASSLEQILEWLLVQMIEYKPLILMPKMHALLPFAI